MEEEAVPFDPNKRFHAHHLVEPHRSHVLMDVRAAAHELGLGAERVAKYVLAGVEAHDEPPGSLLSLLREAATHFPAEDALGMLEHENPRTLRWRIVMMRVLSSRGFPLYSRDELAGLLEAAVVHLNENHDALIAHGHPRTRLVRSSWLHVRVSWLYPVKTPEDARFTPREDGHVEYEYSWGETEKVDVDEDERVRARRIYELSYEDAALHYGLSYADAARLEGLRPKVFDLKARILHQLARALRGGQSEGLEHRCLDLICDVLTYEDSEFLLNQDGELLNFGSRTRVEIEDEHPTGMPRSVTGGLSNLLELIGHCEIELQNGTHHETKGELVALVRDGGLGTLKDLLGPDGYWAALGTTWRAELDGVLDRFWERHRRGWPYFGKPFEFRVTERFEKDLRRTVTLEHKVRAEHASTFERLLRGVGDTVRLYQETTGPVPPWLLPKVPGASPSKEGMVFFSTPPGASWEHVRIRFRDGHTVSVEVLGQRGVFSYGEMGMVSTKNRNPTVQWKLLEAFAEHKGTLSWDSSQADRKNQKRRELLARDLRAFFRIQDDPFCLTEDGKGWRARFQVGLQE